MRLSELRAMLARAEEQFGDVELMDSTRVVLRGAETPSDVPPFAPELADVDPATTGEPDHFGPPVIDSPTPLHRLD